MTPSVALASIEEETVDRPVVPARPRWRHRVLDAVARHLELLFPSCCPLCQSWHERGMGMFCAACIGNLEFQRTREACPTCASSVARYEVSGGRCSQCRGRSLKLRAVARVGPYKEALGKLLRTHKYRARDEFTNLLGGWLAASVAAAPWVSRIEAVVSVPTHWKRRLARPYHVADRVADAVAALLGLPRLPLLRRMRAGPHQIGLSYTERVANVRGAFALGRGYRLDNARLLLVDDVKTSGATLNECAKVLRRVGADEVYGAVVCTAGP